MQGKEKVLLVDDRPDNLMALEALLEPLELDLERATSGEEALKAMIEAEFDAILMDVKLPGLDGFETASYIKGRDKTKHVPLIFVTAERIPGYTIRGFEVGAVDCITKPIDQENLHSLMRRWLRRPEE